MGQKLSASSCFAVLPFSSAGIVQDPVFNCGAIFTLKDGVLLYVLAYEFLISFSVIFSVQSN